MPTTIMVAILAIFATAGAAYLVYIRTTARSSAQAVKDPDRPAISDAAAAYKLVIGAQGSPDPYTPNVLNIPAGKTVALDVTDNIGGCALVTVFPDLGLDGRTVRASVPVGQTRRILLFATKPGRYRYHCSESMFFGEIVAH